MPNRFVLLLFLVFFSANSIAGVVISSEMMTSQLISSSHQASKHTNMPSDCHHDMANQDQSKQHDKHDPCNDCQFCFVHVILSSHEHVVTPPLFVFNPTLNTLLPELVVSRLNRPPQA